MSLRARIEGAWWRPGLGAPAALLSPLALLFGAASASRTLLYRKGLLRSRRLPVPVIIVGNLIVGGAGKTPTVIATVRWLSAQGWRPGVLSRGFGREHAAPLAVTAETSAREAGDEPLLIHRRTGVPLFVGRDRALAGHQLLRAHEDVNVLVCDDGLQHLALARDVEIVVFDRRGAGNGLLLPAGPLRQPLSVVRPGAAIVLYNAEGPTTPIPGFVAQRRLAGALELGAWAAGAAFRPDALHALRGRPVLAAAGIAEPERFFSMLEAEGLTLVRRPLPDHAPFHPPPWDETVTDVIVTEKDAVKLDPDAPRRPRIWVVGLDFVPPAPFFEALAGALAALPALPRRSAHPPWTTD